MPNIRRIFLWFRASESRQRSLQWDHKTWSFTNL